MLLKTKYSLLFLVLFLHLISLSAQDTLPDSVVVQRIRAVEQMLKEGKRGANIWWKGWLVGYSSATIVQGAIAISADNLKTRQDMTLGAFSTLLGAAGQIISPMTGGYTSDDLSEMPEGTPGGNLLKLQTAEELLKKCAEREKYGRSWKTHALDGAVNLGFGAIMYYGLKRSFSESAVNVAINSSVCEAQIFSQPVRAIKDYNSYVKKYKGGSDIVIGPPRVFWYFTMVPGGLGVRMVF